MTFVEELLLRKKLLSMPLIVYIGKAKEDIYDLIMVKVLNLKFLPDTGQLQTSEGEQREANLDVSWQMQSTSADKAKEEPPFFRLAYLSLQLISLFIIILRTYPKMMHQHENGLIKNNLVFTNVKPQDQYENGQMLRLKVDQTFSLKSMNYVRDSGYEGDWGWCASFSIDGVWSYDKQARTITLTTTKFHASLDQPIANEQAVLDKGFPNRVVSTPNFDIETSKEIQCFVVRWDSANFTKVGQGTLKRK